MFSWFKKEQWKLVKIIEDPVTFGLPDQSDSEKQKGSCFFMLFESDRGNRRSEIKSNLRGSKEQLDGYKQRSEIYLKKIYRWEMGRPDPEIPTYNTVAEEDTVNALKGSI